VKLGFLAANVAYVREDIAPAFGAELKRLMGITSS